MSKLKKGTLQTINSLKRKYYNWRYWNNLYGNMKKNLQHYQNNDQGQALPYLNKPGVAFSFDDSYRVNDWAKYGKEIFGYYGVKVTFNINAIHHFEDQRELNQMEIDMLLELQSNGHEIAHHGFKHEKATVYSNQFGISKWIEEEIDPLFDWMSRQSHSKTLEKFKKPVSFAFPHFLFNIQHVSALVPNYFKIARGHLNEDNLTSFNHSGFAPSICLDGYYSNNLFLIKKIMRLSKKAGKNLIITCHSILPKEFDWNDFGWGKEAEKSGKWRTTPETIKSIIGEARKIGLEFYTTSELAGVATFIDPEFEKYVRELIPDNSVEFISISDLVLIKELDLCRKEISNLDGIQYFINLERIILCNNMKGFKLLEKLPKLRKIEIENNNSKDKRNLMFQAN